MGRLEIQQTDDILKRCGAGEVSEPPAILDQSLATEPGERLPDGAGAQLERGRNVRDRQMLARRKTLLEGCSQTCHGHAEGIALSQSDRT